jgi:acetolactate synthase-1/2/3 large subunit
MKTLIKTETTTAKAIVEELTRIGVQKVFGVVSIHNLPIYNEILQNGKIDLISARGESGAANMADGYAKATGKLGVVITSTGTGAGNAAGALVESWSAKTPLLHITGQIASNFIDLGKGYIHECKDQLSMMEGAGKKSYRLRKPEQTVPLMRKAIEKAFEAPSGPVTLEIPIDFQSAIIPEANIPMNENGSNTDQAKIPEISGEIIKKISASKRPVIWAGGGVVKSGAHQEIKALADTLGAAVVTSYSGRGSIPEDHPLCIGNFTAFDLTKKLIEKSDLLLSIGTSFRGNETSNWTLKLPEDHIGINADLNTINLNYPVSNGLVGDAKEIVSALNCALNKQTITPDLEYLDEINHVRKAVRTVVRDTLGPYEAFLDGMQQILPRDTILVQDVTVPATTWGSRLYEIYSPRTSIHAAGLGIGQGLPMAIGAQVGCKDQPVVAMIGDGGIMLNIGELATAAQENLSLVIILFDDAGYGILRNIQDKTYGQQVAVDLSNTDFVALGRSMGVVTNRVGSSQDFVKELETAITRNSPSMIVVDMDSVGSMKKPFAGLDGATKVFKPKRFD